MTEDGSFKRLYVDMVNYTPIASIPRKMKENEELKFADSDRCAHIVFDQEERTKRDLKIFSDDLFKYLLFRRLSIADYCSLLKRTPEDPISNFHPHIGMSVLCCSFSIQKKTFLELLENKLDVHNLDSIATYYTRKLFSLQTRADYSVFQKLRILASVTLELCAFCYLRGNRNAIHYAAAMYSCPFQSVFKKDFFDKGGWSAWKNFVQGDVRYYEKNRCEIPVSGTEILVRGWLKRFDRWIGQFPLQTSLNQINSTAASNVSTNQPSNVKKFSDATRRATSEPDEMTGETSRATSEEILNCLITKDCPSSQRLRKHCNYMMLELIDITSRQKDAAYEDIYQIIENETSVELLMRYCILTKLIINLRDSKIKARNTDILQCMKLILQDNGRMAAYCFIILDNMNQELEKIKSLKKKVPEGKLIGITAENNRQEANSNMNSREHLFPPVKESSSSAYQEHKNLLDRFMLKIKTNDQHCISSVSEICEILSNEAKAEILLTFNIFKIIMRTIVGWNGKTHGYWEEEWILSIMKILIDSQTKDFEHLPTADGAQKIELLSNKVSDVHINPHLTESIPCSVTETAQSSVTSLSDREDIETEPVSDNHMNTEQVENPHQNESSFKNCKQCFNGIKEKLKLVECYPAAAEISNPDKEASVKNGTLEKQGSIKCITCDTSAHKETSSTTKISETTAIDLPLDLHTESTNKDIKRTHYSEYETNNPENKVKKVEKCSNSQPDEYRDCKNGIPFSQEDNSGTIPKTQPVDERSDAASLSEISSV